MWEQPIDANGHTIPITYLGKDGKQYVVIMAGGGGGYFGGTPSDSVMAFALGKDVAPQPLIRSGRLRDEGNDRHDVRNQCNNASATVHIRVTF